MANKTSVFLVAFLATASAPIAEVWTQLAPVGAAPPSRSVSIVVFDAANARLLVHGGSHWNGNEWVYLGHLWAYDLAGDPWTELTPTRATPSGRNRHAGALDAAGGRFLIHGGSGQESGFKGDL